jgi:fatty-acyl-CoA synthase
MLGLMMATPLSITAIMRHAERVHGGREIVSVTADAPRHRYTYRDAFRRVRRLANALRALGVEAGDRIGTLAWNDYRHFELYYGASCYGAICHTINPRLFPEHIAYIINHAADRYLFADVAFVPLLEQLAPELRAVEGVIVLTGDARTPATRLPEALSYEALIADQPDTFDWPQLDERTASALCYTSGTTGHPKGVLYDHRSTVLHAYGAALPDAMGLSAADVVLPIVPMFHANAWGLIYSAAMTGAKLVMPGPKMGDGETLCALINEEQVTLSAGVPTVWLALLRHLQASGRRVDTLKRIVSGGSAVPVSLMRTLEEDYGIAVRHAWGMTEMSPIGTVNVLKPGAGALAGEALDRARARQGRPVFGVEIRIVDDAGRELPWDGRTPGSLEVRGPWVCRDYYAPEAPSSAHRSDGWFATGDVAAIDADGYVQITDRTKDIIKSGGEWISSIDLECAAVAHPDIAEAAVIGVSHPKWMERPLLVVVPAEGAGLTRERVLHFLAERVPRWWLPDDVVFVAAIPHTATGKISKVDLRRQFAGYRLPTA